MTSITDSFGDFLAHERTRNLSDGTLEAYARILDALAVHLEAGGRLTASSATAGDLHAWTLALHGRGLSLGSRRQRIHLAKRAFAWLRRRGTILVDPARQLELPRPEDPLPRMPPCERDLAGMLAALPVESPVQVRDVAILETMYGCLARRGEVIALDLGDVDLDGGTLKFRLAKGAKDRVVPIPERTGDAIERYLAVRERLLGPASGPDERQALFLTERGRRIGRKTILHMIRRVRSYSGMERLHPHLLRHAGAVHLLKGGADIRHVQEILGHSSPNTSAKHYLRLVPRDLKDAYDRAFPRLRV